MARAFPTNGDQISQSVNYGTITKWSASLVARIPSGSPTAGFFGFQGPGGSPSAAFYLFPSGTNLGFYVADGTLQITGTCDYTAFFDTDAVITVAWDGTAGSNATKVLLWINGTAKTLSFDAGAAASSMNAGSGTSFFVGDFDPNGIRPIISELAVWNGVTLSQAQVTEIASTKGCPLFAPGAMPTEYLPLVRDVYNARTGVAPTVTGTSVADHPRILR